MRRRRSSRGRAVIAALFAVAAAPSARATVCESLDRLFVPRPPKVEGLVIRTKALPGRIEASYARSNGEIGYAGYLEYVKIDRTTIRIPHVNVGGEGAYLQPWLRGQGIQEKMFAKLLDEMPEIKRIQSYTLAEVNEEVMYASLMRIMREEKVPLEEASAQAIREATRDLESPIRREFVTRYSEALMRLKESDPERLDSLLTRAVAECPGFRSQEKYGFRLCGPIRGRLFQPSNGAWVSPSYRLLTVVYDVCR